MTTIAAALKAWEEKTGTPPSEAKKITLYAQMPPITKLDNSLNTLVKCEHLALSTNSIDKFIPLGGMQSLKILSVGRNLLKKFEKLEENAGTLTELWASYNQINTLDGLSTLKNLEILYLSNNLISKWEELEKLAENENLRDILLAGNPIAEGLAEEDFRIQVLKHMSKNTNLVKIDNKLIKPSEWEKSTTSS